MQFESCLSLKQQQLPFGVSVLLLSAAGAKVRSQGSFGGLGRPKGAIHGTGAPASGLLGNAYSPYICVKDS